MEGFRILEITQPSELHVTANQLTVEQEPEPKKKRKLSVPLEDLELIICTGANIRVSTMALSVLSLQEEQKVCAFSLAQVPVLQSTD